MILKSEGEKFGSAFRYVDLKHLEHLIHLVKELNIKILWNLKDFDDGV
jgi:hypothetical protein